MQMSSSSYGTSEVKVTFISETRPDNHYRLTLFQHAGSIQTYLCVAVSAKNHFLTGR